MSVAKHFYAVGVYVFFLQSQQDDGCGSTDEDTQVHEKVISQSSRYILRWGCCGRQMEGFSGRKWAGS